MSEIKTNWKYCKYCRGIKNPKKDTIDSEMPKICDCSLNKKTETYSKWPFILSCIRCDCEIERIEGMLYNWDGAVDVTFHAHYGSIHDMMWDTNSIKRAICDNCFEIILNQ